MQKPTNPVLIESHEEDFHFWEDKKDKLLEKKYAEIATDIPLVNVRHSKLFLEQTKALYEELVSKVPGMENTERWDEYEIIRMFGKGLNPTSLKTTLNNVQYFVEKLDTNSDKVRILEFGSGSGWSTIMLRQQLKKKFSDKKIEIFSVDMSPHSIVATENSLNYYNFPWQTIVGCTDITTVPDSSERITLILKDFISILKCQEDNSIDGFFSSHGTAYLSEAEYKELLGLITQKGKNGSPFVADSLDPLYTVDLSVPHLLFCSLFPARAEKMEEYVYGKNLISNSKYFPNREVRKLVKVNNEESFLFYRWNNYLLSKLKVGYLLQMLKSIRVTTDVIEEYREDVYPGYLVSSLVNRNKALSNLKPCKDLPKCPLYITNCGLILEK